MEFWNFRRSDRLWLLVSDFVTYLISSNFLCLSVSIRALYQKLWSFEVFST